MSDFQNKEPAKHWFIHLLSPSLSPSLSLSLSVTLLSLSPLSLSLSLSPPLSPSPSLSLLSVGCVSLGIVVLLIRSAKHSPLFMCSLKGKSREEASCFTGAHAPA